MKTVNISLNQRQASFSQDNGIVPNDLSFRFYGTKINYRNMIPLEQCKGGDLILSTTVIYDNINLLNNKIDSKFRFRSTSFVSFCPQSS